MRIRRKSLNYFLLLAIEKAVDGYMCFDDFVNNSKDYAYGRERNLRKSDFALAIRSLRERGLVKTEVDEGKIIITLTELGKDSILVINEAKWDGKWRLVIYDIPEDKRVVRDLLRRRLKEWGFVKWQQSIWITKSNITDKLRRLISRLGIESWVVVMESNDPVISKLTQRPLH